MFSMPPKAKEKRYCIVCGSVLKGKAKSTCSRECYKISLQNKPRNKESAPNYKPQLHIERHRYCLYCGRDISVKYRDLKNPRALYCNEFCRTQFTYYLKQSHIGGCTDYTTKVCGKCGMEFVTVNDYEDYCCIECSGNEVIHKVVHQGECAYCGKHFRQKNKDDIYCSNRCFIKSKLESPYVVKRKACENCNIERNGDIEDIRAGKLSFCNNDCYKDFLNMVYWEENVKLGIYHDKPIVLICEACGAQFMSFKEGVKYCCNICSDPNPTRYYPDDMQYNFDTIDSDSKNKDDNEISWL